VRLQGLGKLKKCTSSGTQTGDLPVCSIVPQPTTLPRALCPGAYLIEYRDNFVFTCFYTVGNKTVIFCGKSRRALLYRGATPECDETLLKSKVQQSCFISEGEGHHLPFDSLLSSHKRFYLFTSTFIIPYLQTECIFIIIIIYNFNVVVLCSSQLLNSLCISLRLCFYSYIFYIHVFSSSSACL
jgi:hypothetical protein